jgi:hypothetical protein
MVESIIIQINPPFSFTFRNMEVQKQVTGQGEVVDDPMGTGRDHPPVATMVNI